MKSLIQSLGGEAWGHSVTLLLGEAGAKVEVPDRTTEAAQRLDKHYLPTRYPNGFDRGAPTDFYTDAEAGAAIEDADEVLGFCRRSMG